MKNSGAAIASAATFAAAGALCIGSAAAALADVAAPGSNSQTLGSPVNIGGQAWTVSNLKQSSDVIPYQPHGTLWEATATDEAVQGGATPIVSDLNATSPGGQTYRVLYQVATPQGINPAGLAQGQKTTGKVYFDVTGDNPNAVVYREAGGQDLASWVQSTTPGGGGRAVKSGTGGQSTATPANKPATSAGNATPTPAGSQGTPIPAGSQGTPATGAAPAATPPGGPGTPPPAGNPEVPAGAPAPAGSPDAGAPGAPAPAAVPGAPAAGPEAPAQVPGNPPPAVGSQGSAASAGTPAAPASPAAPAPAPGDATPPGNGSAAPTGSQGSQG
ncbi:DUF1942 domain-containing protein [Mycobacterium sp.]|uniref:DUF1942 domain-containing protein n=1 Tax=Mycobacterium sp. TaxID=1785 RepID=UPI0031E05824